MRRAFVDLHCHSKGSFDCLSDPKEIVKAASDRGLTHLAITDHDRIDVALEARELAPEGLTILIGEEVKTADGDLICVFLERAIQPGMSAMETIAAAREQGGLVGIPHPFDRMRGSLLRDAAMASLAPHVDWIEAYNARVVGHGNDDAAEFAIANGKPGISVSDAHSIMEVGVAYTALDGDPSTPAGLLAALASAEVVPGRATYFVRLWTPLAKGVNRLRGNSRVRS
ncbi:MAG: PHP domain-containing protein [Thermomicrobiales bacterium]|jgi:predicted metal-dependent phosphoesterase TrpH|nr:MAG: PHP domain-containing protein [Thermomicrobiales bacterium]